MHQQLERNCSREGGSMIHLIVDGDFDIPEEIVSKMSAAQGRIEVVHARPNFNSRRDLDALVLPRRIVAEDLGGTVARSPSEFIMDEASGKHVLILEAAISARPPERVNDFGAPWVVAETALAQIDPNRTEDEACYAMILNELEVMERHNLMGYQPIIHRVGYSLGTYCREGLLSAYRAYSGRWLAGKYASGSVNSP